ncbi:MAG: hypothetical protein KAZ87_08910 [Spirochaetes bacterium]|nr:hypothetical protein [Spirochaetota bacterium]
MNDSIGNKLSVMTDDNLIRELSSDRDSFREGVYEMYQNEIMKRGITEQELEEKIAVIRDEIIQRKGQNLFKLGLVMLIFVMFVSIPSFIIGRYLKKKDQNGEYVFNEKLRKKSRILLILPVVLWCIIFLLVLIPFILVLADIVMSFIVKVVVTS